PVSNRITNVAKHLSMQGDCAESLTLLESLIANQRQDDVGCNTAIAWQECLQLGGLLPQFGKDPSITLDQMTRINDDIDSRILRTTISDREPLLLIYCQWYKARLADLKHDERTAKACYIGMEPLIGRVLRKGFAETLLVCTDATQYLEMHDAAEAARRL